MRQHKPSKDQLRIDFVRGKRKTCVEQMRLGPFSYVNANGKTVKVCRTSHPRLALRVIESHARDGGECQLRIKTIANEMGVSVVTASRAISACIGRGLLTVKRSFSPNGASAYQIIWHEVIQVILDHPETAALIDLTARREQTEKRTHVDLKRTHIKSEGTHVDSEGTHVNSESDGDGDTSSSRARGFETIINQMIKPVFKPYGDDDGENAGESPVSKPGASSSASSSRSTGNFPAKTFAGWPYAIAVGHLESRSKVQELWEWASAHFTESPVPRHEFFCLAFYVIEENRKGNIANPGAYFSARVGERLWMGSTDYSRDHGTRDYSEAASAMIAAIDTSQRPPERSAGDGATHPNYESCVRGLMALQARINGTESDE